MNIQFQICGLCILFLMIIFYMSHKNLHLYQETVFFVILCIMTISLIMDILSLAAIKNRGILPELFVNFVCKTYVNTLILVVWSALIYILSDFVTKKRRKIIMRLSIFFLVIQSIIVYSLPIHIYDEGGQLYTYGPAILCVYAFVALYIFIILGIVFFFRKSLHSGRMFAIIVWMSIWLVSASIQFFNSALLLVGFAGTLGVLILFMVIENPEGNIERKYGCFNSYALTEYLKKMYEDGKSFSILEISISNSKKNNLEEKGIDIDQVIERILSLCHKKIYSFCNVNRDLILISNSSERLMDTYEAIEKEWQSDYLIHNNTYFTLIPQGELLSDADNLFRFLAFVKTEYRKEKNFLIRADQEMISCFENHYLIEREISLALEENRVEAFLQPIFSTREKRFTSAEALVRIRKQDGALLSPGVFIPVAEKNGQILALGDRIFEEVCWILKNTDIIKLGIHYVEINLSVVQCEKENLAEELIAITEKYQINPKYINLEITETASIRAKNNLLKNMKKLIHYGFTFSLDDFGKGQSNLMYVVNMPVSILKLDYDMSKAFFHNPKVKQVVRAIVNMSHGMDLKIVAEGIETGDEAQQIIDEGIDYIQGYYYSKPLPFEEFLKFIA